MHTTSPRKPPKTRRLNYEENCHQTRQRINLGKIVANIGDRGWDTHLTVFSLVEEDYRIWSSKASVCSAESKTECALPRRSDAREAFRCGHLYNTTKDTGMEEIEEFNHINKIFSGQKNSSESVVKAWKEVTKDKRNV